MIKFIYFDLGGVVINNRISNAKMAEMANAAPEAVQDFFVQNWRKACEGMLDSAAYMQMFKDTFTAPHMPDDYVTVLTDTQGFYEETHALIYELATEYKLGILSNAELGVIDALMSKKKIPDVSWHAVIESAKHKLVKPDAAIYELAESMSGVLPHEILFVDDLAHNIAAAEARGWSGVIFDTDDVSASVANVKNKLHALKKKHK